MAKHSNATGFAAVHLRDCGTHLLKMRWDGARGEGEVDGDETEDASNGHVAAVYTSQSTLFTLFLSLIFVKPAPVSHRFPNSPDCGEGMLPGR